MSQPLVAAPVAAHLAPGQAAWLRFVDRVERGELVDPRGQYVAKGTPGAVDATGHRIVRPKFDAAVPDAVGQRAGAPAAGTSGASNSLTTPDDPPQPCDGCPGGPVTVTSTFATSENQGGSGYIHDLKLISGATSQQRISGAGYSILNSDLNKGAGGAYIYLCFQRNPLQVLNGVEYTYNYSYSGPNDILTAFQTQYGSFTNSTPRPDDYFYTIWVPNQNPNVFWDRVDLNAGAGGEYIYSFQAKSPLVANYIYIQEVGILSGNSSTIQPPTGWNKYPQDLNEGAGGDYIYFCYR